MYYRNEGDFLDGLRTFGPGEGRATAGKGIEDGKRKIHTCCCQSLRLEYFLSLRAVFLEEEYIFLVVIV